MARLGIAFSGGPGPAEIVDCVRLAEALGYESAWVAEGHGGDQFAILAACAARTSRIRLCTADPLAVRARSGCRGPVRGGDPRLRPGASSKR